MNPDFEGLYDEFEQCTQALVQCIANVPSTSFLFKPATDKWSIAEIAEHINISDKSAWLAMIRSHGKPDLDQLALAAGKMDEMLQGENIRFVAPDSAVPKSIFKESAQAVVQIEKTRKKIATLMQQEDLKDLASGFEHPRLGYLTREQWIRFIIWHTRHHLKQIDAIAELKIPE